MLSFRSAALGMRQNRIHRFAYEGARPALCCGAILSDLPVNADGHRHLFANGGETEKPAECTCHDAAPALDLGLSLPNGWRRLGVKRLHSGGQEFSVRAMCRMPVVHFSGLAAWRKEPLSLRALEDMRQTDLIHRHGPIAGKYMDTASYMTICAMQLRLFQRTVLRVWPA